MANPTKRRRKNTNARKSQSGKKSDGSSVVNQTLQNNLLEHFGLKLEEYRPIAEFQKLKGREKLKGARKIIQDSIIDGQELPDERCALSIAESESLLKGYATLDEPHRAEITNLIQHITEYLRTHHGTVRQRSYVCSSGCR